MKKVFLILIILIVFSLAAVFCVMYFKPYAGLLTAIDKFKGAAGEKISPQPPQAAKEENYSPDTVMVYLKNNSVLSGRLLRETPADVTILWKGGEISFTRNEIERLEYGKGIEEKEGLLFGGEESEKWPYKNDIVLALTSGAKLDGAIEKVYPEKVVIKYLVDEGGYIEQEVERGQIEYLLFKPVSNELTTQIETSLQGTFPNMKFYKEGLFTIVTDTSNIWVEKYAKVLRQHVTDFYFTFFDLLKERKPAAQHFVVIFDKFGDYAHYAITDGCPGWSVAGYFHDVDKTLYLFNFLGEDIDGLIHEVYLAEIRKQIGLFEDFFKEKINRRYHIFLEGLADEVRGKVVKFFNIVKNDYRNLTYTILRHESIHELFSLWGLQSIITSKANDAWKNEYTEKKKKFLETENMEDKKEILRGLISQREEEWETIKYEIEAANSWFVEGLATYCETDPIGSRNDYMLYYFQGARRKNMLLPLEQLTVYRLGSFHGVASEAKLFAYAQSWAFTYFLMNNYRSQFIKYLERMATQKSKGNEDLLWLIEALGKDMRSLEAEFLAYMDQFEKVEDPDLYLRETNLAFEIFY